MALRLPYLAFLLGLSLVVHLRCAQCEKLLQAAQAPAGAPVVAIVADAAASRKPAVKKGPALPPLKVACQTNRISGWPVPWIVWNCRIKSSPAQKPFCLKLSCANVNTGGCPVAGQGPTGTIAPVACGWGLQANGDGTCTTQFPIFPKSDTGYGFTIDSRLPLNVKIIKSFAALGNMCNEQGGLV